LAEREVIRMSIMRYSPQSKTYTPQGRDGKWAPKVLTGNTQQKVPTGQVTYPSGHQGPPNILSQKK